MSTSHSMLHSVSQCRPKRSVWLISWTSDLKAVSALLRLLCSALQSSLKQPGAFRVHRFSRRSVRRVTTRPVRSACERRYHSL